MEDGTVLVTGGAGFIGSNVANGLAEGSDVVAVGDCYLDAQRALTTKSSSSNGAYWTMTCRPTWTW